MSVAGSGTESDRVPWLLGAPSSANLLEQQKLYVRHQGSNLKSFGEGQHIHLDLPAGSTKYVYADMKSQLLLWVKVPDLNLESKKLVLISDGNLSGGHEKRENRLSKQLPLYNRAQQQKKKESWLQSWKLPIYVGKTVKCSLIDVLRRKKKQSQIEKQDDLNKKAILELKMEVGDDENRPIQVTFEYQAEADDAFLESQENQELGISLSTQRQGESLLDSTFS
eukprot:TRINITY_DN16132_c0_g1_i4.p1 TRINITY_DN16132_c0_g1~~TRINITY_DN16132_c0_g1_i4.p1  ORF type:complete len:248 (-),score=35.08 TRINITY_DN16132_c0_g1_i4:109-777(-)